MKTKDKKRGSKQTLTTFWAAVLMVTVLAAAPWALASTAENTEIVNEVTVTYEDADNNPQDAITAQATVTVALVPAEPTISSPASVDPATEGQAVTLGYVVTGNANGDDSYTISTLITEVDLGDEASVVINGGTPSITLGGTTLAAATDGTNTITVPYDGSDDDIVNSIESGDTIIIGGTAYEVDTIDEDDNATTATITLTTSPPATGAGSGSVGDVVGEQMQIDVVVTTGVLSGTATNGTHTVTATIASATHNIDQDTLTVITVRRPLLTVTKYVQDIDDPVSSGTGDSYTVDTGDGERTYYQNIQTPPEHTLEYIIVVTNGENTDGGVATNVVIEDTIPPFTTYVPASMKLDPGNGTFVDLNDTTADAGETDGNDPVETIWIYAGNGGSDADAGATTGTGGTLAAGATTIGVFRVTIE